MSTRSLICKKEADNSFKVVYCHWDGYPKHVGRILEEFYNTAADIDELLSYGDISILGPELGEEHDFSWHFSDSPDYELYEEYGMLWSTFRGRDKGDTGAEAELVENPFDLVYDQEFVYIWDGKWNCYDFTDDVWVYGGEDLDYLVGV